MKYQIWTLDEKTNVPFKVLDTESRALFIDEIMIHTIQGNQFATRVEKL